MSLPDSLPASNPASVVKTFHDTGVPHAALALLPALHRQAGRDLELWRLLARTPLFCSALMLQGAAILAWTVRTESGGLDVCFLWAVSLLLGIGAMTRNHIRVIACSPREMALRDAARELRMLLVYTGISWGLGAFLISPQEPALVLVFAAVPVLTALLILKDRKSAIAFGIPLSILSAAAVARPGGPLWVAGMIAAGVSIAGLSMLQCAMLARRAQD